MDLDGKTLIIFLLEQPESHMVAAENIQTRTLPHFQYVFNPSRPKSMGQGRDYFPSQRKKNDQDQLKFCSFSDCVCSICGQCVMITDEYIRLLDCNHIYHRICMIHSIAQATSKRFFLTRKEQLKEFEEKDQPLSLCPNCKLEDAQYGYLSKVKGYRKHIVFDLLKDKADLFYSKMKERKVLEFSNPVKGPKEDGLGESHPADRADCDEDSEDLEEENRGGSLIYNRANREQDINQDGADGGTGESLGRFYQIKWKNTRNV